MINHKNYSLLINFKILNPKKIKTSRLKICNDKKKRIFAKY